MNHTEALTSSQEQALVVAAEGGDAEASRRLVEVFMPGITRLALGFPTLQASSARSFISEESGLLFAVRRYDPRLNTPFWAYASFWVRKAMQELVAELTRPVALSDRAVRALAHIRSARREYVQAHGTEPTVDQLSGATGIHAAQLESLRATERRPRALEEPLGAGTETSGTVGDTIVDPAAEQAYEHVLDRIELCEVRDVAEQLDERERAVIRAHYGLLGQPAETFDQIGRGLA